MKRLIATLVLGSAAFCPAVQAEGTMAWTSIGYATPRGTDSKILNPESRTAPSGAEVSWTEAPYSAWARSNAAFGTIQGGAGVVSSQGGNISHYINAGFADELTLSRPDLAGQPGQITLNFHYDNRIAPTASVESQGYAYVDWHFYVNDTIGSVSETYNLGSYAGGRTKYTYFYDANGSRQEETSFDDHLLAVTADFVWGQPVLFAFSLGTSGQAVDETRYEIDAVGYWAGIASATAGGAVVGDYTLASRTGVDYSRPFVSPVPEPHSYALLAAGLLVFAWRRRAGRPQAGTAGASSTLASAVRS